MSVLATWRQAVADHLDAQFSEYVVYSGFRQGQNRELNVISVFSPGLGEIPERVHVSELRLLVRAWPRVVPATGGEAPLDPSPLEDLALALEGALQSVQTSLASSAGVWFTRLQRVEIDYEEWGCQATLVAWANNPAVVA